MIHGSNLKKPKQPTKQATQTEKRKNSTKTSYSCIALYNNRVGLKQTFMIVPGNRISCSISENIQDALYMKKKISSSWLASEILSMVNYQKVKVQQEGLPNLHSSNGFSLEG